MTNMHMQPWHGLAGGPTKGDLSLDGQVERGMVRMVRMVGRVAGVMLVRVLRTRTETHAGPVEINSVLSLPPTALRACHRSPFVTAYWLRVT